MRKLHLVLALMLASPCLAAEESTGSSPLELQGGDIGPTGIEKDVQPPAEHGVDIQMEIEKLGMQPEKKPAKAAKKKKKAAKPAPVQKSTAPISVP